ncbi:MAG: NlpC/P60 family protein [Spirochaeta sp.]
MRAVLPVLVTGILILQVSCVTFSHASSEGQKEAGQRARSAHDSDDFSDIRAALVAAAYDVLGAESLEVRDRSFRIDCTGVVQAIYYSAGIDLIAPLGAYSGNGVVRLHSYLADEQLVHGGREALPGDLIFWDNTYDRNKSGRPDDKLTHVGMIVSVEDNGDIQYIHHNYARGIVIEYMNLQTPEVHSRIEDGNTVIVNSFMRARSAPDYDKTLSGELINSLAQAYLLGDPDSD